MSETNDTSQPSVLEALSREDFWTWQRRLPRKADQARTFLKEHGQDKYGSTALHYASGYGNLQVCQYLLQQPFASSSTSSSPQRDSALPPQQSKPLVNPLAISSNNDRTALHWAARNGYPDICRLLVEAPTAKIPVDIEARGQVTPLQLAVWQGHLKTSKVLVDELGADPHYLNAWGCSVAHWLAKCPLYGEANRNSQLSVHASQQSNQDDHPLYLRMIKCCHWLFDECHVPWNLANTHGQTPLHKAAFAGNLPLLEFLVLERGCRDDQRDHQGNTAADCAERSSLPQAKQVAQWLRYHASPLRDQALKTLLSWTNTTEQNCTQRMPTLDELKSLYRTLVKRYHPDKQLTKELGYGFGQNSGERKIVNVNSRSLSGLVNWYVLQQSYQLLLDWWTAPDLYDVTIRIQTRNGALQDYLAILWWPDWHEEQKQSSQWATSHVTSDSKGGNTKEKILSDFERHLVRLLLTDAYRTKGLSLAQLPKEYAKNYPDSMSLDTQNRTALPIDPKQYKCKKLSHVLERYCPNLTIHRDPAGKQQPRIFATCAYYSGEPL